MRVQTNGVFARFEGSLIEVKKVVAQRHPIGNKRSVFIQFAGIVKCGKRLLIVPFELLQPRVGHQVPQTSRIRIQRFTKVYFSKSEVAR